MKITKDQLREMIREVLLDEKKKKKRKKRKVKRKKRKLTSKPGSETSLRDWFGRKGAPGKKGGWVDCNAPKYKKGKKKKTKTKKKKK